MDHENIAEEETVMSQQILFQGTLKKIRIVSNALSYGLEPGHDEEVEQPVIRSHKERLVIDRETGTLEYRKEYGGENRVSGKYEMKDKIENLLDEFDAEELFSYVEENPDDVIDTPDENLSYKITVDYKKNPQRVIEGDFDRKSLPEDFADFIERVSRFIRCYGIGDIFNPLIYRKKKRCKSDYIFCSVIFESPYKSYYYLTDDDSIDIGDFVIVPAGKDNHEAIVEVIHIEYFSEADAPFPVDNTKKIIRKCTDEEVDLLEGY